MKANRKELAVLRGKRTPETLEEWAKAFGEGDRARAQRYALAVATFLGQNPQGEWSDYLGQLSPNTRVAYAYAVAEFFEWAAVRHKRIVPPHEVTRKDAEEYVNWLANRPYSLAEEKLKDGDMPELLEIYEIVKDAKNPIGLRRIKERLSDSTKAQYFYDLESAGGEKFAGQYRKFHHEVRKLITLDVLEGIPTFEELRKRFPQAGITQWAIDDKPLEDMFTYKVKTYKPVARTTVAQRIAALSQFWKILMQGENLKGGEALLEYDVWESVKKRVNRGIAPEKRQAARQQKMPTEIVLKMLQHAPSKTVVNQRDRAILYLLVFTGLRASELLKLRRSKSGDKMPHFDGSEPPAIRVLRKGNKWMRIPYPPVALKELIEFQARIDAKAVPPFAQHKNAKAEDFVEYGVGYYYRDLTLPDAPLFPSLVFWGANDEIPDYRRSMSRVNLFKLLRKMAIEVGLSEEDVKKVHPHAFRHFAATAMAAGGKDLREIQHMLGHTSITTTEGYLEDIDDEVKLSGQAEILDFLKAQGVQIEPTHVGEEKPKRRQEPEVIDTFGSDEGFIEEEEAPQQKKPKGLSTLVQINLDARVEVQPDLDLTRPEVLMLSGFTDPAPVNDTFQNPDFEAPSSMLVSTPEGRVEVSSQGKVLIGISPEEEPSQELLDSIVAPHVVSDDRPASVGSPDWVYEALATKGDYEPVVFNRGGQKDIKWLNLHYPKMPQDFGVGIMSLLPWYVKARGNISAAGFSRGMPPFPVWSYLFQASPTTPAGRYFISEVEKAHQLLMYGDPATGSAPSPIRAAGLIRWFGFFNYIAAKFHHKFTGGSSDMPVMQADSPEFKPFEDVVTLGSLRMHKNEWLMEWLEKNSHTFRSSVDSMKRGVQRGEISKGEEGDPASLFLKSSFEGIDLIKEMPDWMIEDDPVNALYRDDPSQYKEFVKWLLNLTGQALSVERRSDLDEAKRQQVARIASIRTALEEMYAARDRLSQEKFKGRAKKKGGDKEDGPKSSEEAQYGLADAQSPEVMKEEREALRLRLFIYLVLATGISDEQELGVTRLELLQMTTPSFVKKMGELFDKYKIPNPDAEKYRGRSVKTQQGGVTKAGEGPSRVKARIDMILKDLFPEEELLSGMNVFGESPLFNPEWFRVDMENHTIFVEPEAADRLVAIYGIEQSPQLLLRRAARAMWEAKDKGKDKLWGVLMCYFSWIVPTGAQMEAEATGIPIENVSNESWDRDAREEWLRVYVNSMDAIAQGKPLAEALRRVRVKPGESVVVESDAVALETAGPTGIDQFTIGVVSHAMTGVDFVASQSMAAFVPVADKEFFFEEDEEEAADDSDFEETLKKEQEAVLRRRAQEAKRVSEAAARSESLGEEAYLAVAQQEAAARAVREAEMLQLEEQRKLAAAKGEQERRERAARLKEAQQQREQAEREQRVRAEEARRALAARVAAGERPLSKKQEEEAPAPAKAEKKRPRSKEEIEEEREEAKRLAKEEALRKLREERRSSRDEPEEEEEDEDAGPRRPRPLRKNRRTGFTPNGKSLYMMLEGEVPSGFYEVNIFGTRGMRPNGAVTELVSPGIVYAVQKKIRPAVELLPSPFLMFAAMELE